jgi:hypothetical protein
MTLLEKFIQCKHNTRLHDQVPLGEYANWLEGLCYQLIKERQDQMHEALDAAHDVAASDTLLDGVKANIIPFPGKAPEPGSES